MTLIVLNVFDEKTKEGWRDSRMEKNKGGNRKDEKRGLKAEPRFLPAEAINAFFTTSMNPRREQTKEAVKQRCRQERESRERRERRETEKEERRERRERRL